MTKTNAFINLKATDVRILMPICRASCTNQGRMPYQRLLTYVRNYFSPDLCIYVLALKNRVLQTNHCSMKYTKKLKLEFLPEVTDEQSHKLEFVSEVTGVQKQKLEFPSDVTGVQKQKLEFQSEVTSEHS